MVNTSKHVRLQARRDRERESERARERDKRQRDSATVVDAPAMYKNNETRDHKRTACHE